MHAVKRAVHSQPLLCVINTLMPAFIHLLFIARFILSFFIESHSLVLLYFIHYVIIRPL